MFVAFGTHLPYFAHVKPVMCQTGMMVSMDCSRREAGIDRLVRVDLCMFGRPAGRGAARMPEPHH